MKRSPFSFFHCPHCLSRGIEKASLEKKRSALACARCSSSFAIHDSIAIFSPKKDGIFEEARFVNSYVESHFRDFLIPHVNSKQSVKKNDHTGFYDLPANENYYEDAIAFLLEDCPSLSCALDLGCSVGRSTMALARSASTVFGVDPSVLQIQTAHKILSTESIHVHVGQSLSPHPDAQGVSLVVLLPFKPPKNVTYVVADHETLPFQAGLFDAICCSAVIDCTEDPSSFVQTLERLTHPHSRVLVSTPFEWLVKDTPAENWLGSGAFGTAKGSPDKALIELMSRHHFRLLREKDLRWVTTVHSRKYIVWSVYAGVFERL